MNTVQSVVEPERIRAIFRTCSIAGIEQEQAQGSGHEQAVNLKEHSMINPNTHVEQPVLISESVVEALTATTLAISGFLALLIFAAV